MEYRKMTDAPDTNRLVIVQTNYDVYQCRYINGEWEWPGRFNLWENKDEYPIGWYESMIQDTDTGVCEHGRAIDSYCEECGRIHSA